MYEQLSLFDSEQKKDKPKKETLFEQILPVIKNPLIPCANCLCRYCTHNVECIPENLIIRFAGN